MESTVRIIVTPSSTRLPPETPDSVVVSGSHSAIFTVYLAARARARAAILHDAGIGLDQAGVLGLAWAEKLGMAVAAVAASSARIGDGDDMMRRGVLSRVNQIAAACGVTAGMTCRDAAERLRNAPLPHTLPEPRDWSGMTHLMIDYKPMAAFPGYWEDRKHWLSAEFRAYMETEILPTPPRPGVTIPGSV